MVASTETNGSANGAASRNGARADPEPFGRTARILTEVGGERVQVGLAAPQRLERVGPIRRLVDRVLGRRRNLVAGDGWDRGGVGFLAPTIQGRPRVLDPYKESVWVRIALKARAQPFSRLPLRLYPKDPKQNPGVEPVDDSHPLVRLWRRPNRALTGEDLWFVHMLGYSLTGGVYYFLVRDALQEGGIDAEPKPIDEGGIPSSVIPILQSDITVKKRDAAGIPINYSYKVRGSRKIDITFPAHAVLTILDINPRDFTRGYGDVQALAPYIDSEHQALRYLASYVRSGGDPGAWFRFRSNIGSAEADRLQAKTDDEYAATNVSRYKFLSGDIEEVIPNRARPRDMEYEKLLKWDRAAILGMLAVPEPIAGILERAIYNNIKVAELLVWRAPNGIISVVRRTENALNQKFLADIAASRAPGVDGVERVGADWRYRFDLSEVEVLREDNLIEITKAIELAARGSGISAAEILKMLGVEATFDDEEDSAVNQRWVARNLRPAEDAAGESAANVLSQLAQRVASHQVPVESAVAIAVATMPGTVDESVARKMFPDPGPKPEPVVVVQPVGPDGADGEGDESDGGGPTPASEDDDDDLELGARRASAPVFDARLAFRVGQPIEPDPALTAIVEAWVGDFVQAQIDSLHQFVKDARDRGELAKTRRQHLDIDLSAIESLMISQDLWAALLAESASPQIQDIFLKALAATREALGGPFIGVTDPRVIEALVNQSINFTRISASLREDIRDAIAAVLVGETEESLAVVVARLLPDLDAGLENVFGTKEARALAISRTETGHARNGASFLQMRESGVIRIAWVHGGNPNPRPEHLALDGVEVTLGEKFSNGMLHAHDPDAGPEDVVNCSCSFRATAFEGED